MARPRSWRVPSGPMVPVPLMRMTPASPPGPCTVLVCTMRVVLLEDPALGADVGRRRGAFSGRRCSRAAFRVLRALPRAGRAGTGRLPGADGAVVERRVVGEGLVGNVGDELAVMAGCAGAARERRCRRWWRRVPTWRRR